MKIEVERGWLTLTGAVDRRYQRDLALDDIRRLRGVVCISNLITVGPGAKIEEISDAIMDALHRSWCFDSTPIQVKAHGAWFGFAGPCARPMSGSWRRPPPGPPRA